MNKLILTLTIMTLTITTTVGLVQLSAVFAPAPPQGGNPHGDFHITSPKGDPHSLLASKGNPHLCETQSEGGSQSSGAGAGKTVQEQC